MPIFIASLRFGSDIPGQPPRKWSNRFILNSPNIGEAELAAQEFWVDSLRAAARERVWCYETYVTSAAIGDDVFTVTPIPIGQQRGTLPSPSGEPYLPEACLSVNLNVFASRPSRKFWRPGLYDADVNNGVTVSAAVITAVTNAFTALVNGYPGILVDPDNQEISSVGRIRFGTREFGRESTQDVPAAPPLG